MKTGRSARNRGRRWGVAALAALFLGACSTAQNPFPESGTVTAAFSDPSLGGQTGPLTAQIDEWTIASLSMSVSTLPEAYELVDSPCIITYGSRSTGDLRTSCGASGVVLDDSTPTTLSVMLTLSNVRRFRADRPSLPDVGDEDRDGIPNGTDSCVIVPNADQTSSTDYTACSVLGQSTVSDQDRDGIGDGSDNCRFVFNPNDPRTTRQADSNGNGIGDACERQIPVPLPGGSPARIECPLLDSNGDPLAILPGDARLTVLTLQFADNAAYQCDADLTACTLDPAGVRLTGSLRTPNATLPLDYSGACRAAP